jgi:hypothetical protein
VDSVQATSVQSTFSHLILFKIHFNIKIRRIHVPPKLFLSGLPTKIKHYAYAVLISVMWLLSYSSRRISSKICNKMFYEQLTLNSLNLNVRQAMNWEQFWCLSNTKKTDW